MFINFRTLLYGILTLFTTYAGYKGYRRVTYLPSYQKLEPIPVDIEPIETRFLARREVFSSKLSADESVSIIVETPGRIKKLNIQEGKEVKAGTLLVKLDDEQQLAQLTTYQTQYERALRSFEQAKILAQKGDIPLITLKDKESDLKTAKAKRDEADAMVHKTEIRAPFDGVVGIRQQSVGAFVQPNTEITKLNKLDPLRVHFSVPADRIKYVIPGSTVQVNIGSQAIPVRATIIAKESNLQSHNHLLDVVALLPNPNREYIPGQYASVSLVTSQEDDVLAVPETALVYGDNDRVFVFIVKDNRAVETPVDLGVRRGGGYVEINGGISEKDEIIVDVGESKGMRIIDGTPVKTRG